MAKHTASPARTGRENPYLQFVTVSVAWLNLEPGGNTTRSSTTEENAFQQPADGGHLLNIYQSSLLWGHYYKGAVWIEDVTDLI